MSEYIILNCFVLDYLQYRYFDIVIMTDTKVGMKIKFFK